MGTCALEPCTERGIRCARRGEAHTRVRSKRQRHAAVLLHVFPRARGGVRPTRVPPPRSCAHDTPLEALRVVSWQEVTYVRLPHQTGHLRTYTEARCVARPSTFPARRVRSEGGAAHTGVAPRGCSNALAAGGRAAPAQIILPVHRLRLFVVRRGKTENEKEKRLLPYSYSDDDTGGLSGRPPLRVGLFHGTKDPAKSPHV